MLSWLVLIRATAFPQFMEQFKVLQPHQNEAANNSKRHHR